MGWLRPSSRQPHRHGDPRARGPAVFSAVDRRSGITTTGGTFAGALFNSTTLISPGQVITNARCPRALLPPAIPLGTIVGLTEANADYLSPIYSAFTDFGTPAQGGIPARPGASGVQGSNGELLIGSASTGCHPHHPDQTGAVSSQIRRFEDIAFDQVRILLAERGNCPRPPRRTQ